VMPSRVTDEALLSEPPEGIWGKCPPCWLPDSVCGSVYVYACVCVRVCALMRV
jgi:hypothetical protein